MRIRISTKGGKPSKDRMFEKRLEQELSKNTRSTAANSQQMTFGKHKGVSILDVESDYLLWCATQMKNCPSYVYDELKYRGYDESFMPPWKDNVH